MYVLICNTVKINFKIVITYIVILLNYKTVDLYTCTCMGIYNTVLYSTCVPGVGNIGRECPGPV